MLSDIITKEIICLKVINIQPDSCLIIDGQALVVALGKPNNALNFGNLVDIFVKTVLQAGAKYQRIDILFDIYQQESIKAGTREWWTKSAKPIRQVIENRELPLPKNWQTFLALADNKTNLANFWSENFLITASLDKEIVVAGEFYDELEVKSSKVTTDINYLKAKHEEADSRICITCRSKQI